MAEAATEPETTAEDPATEQGPRTYVITGASSGIGLELCRQLAARGDKVYATVRTKESSMTGVDQISDVAGDVTIIEGIDVASDDVGAVLAESALAGVQIDVIVHNAGSLNATREVDGAEVFPEQSLANITPERMLATFNLNTLGPLRLQQALGAQMASPGGKVAIISTGMGSIGDNGSGGLYAYRASKAAVNMVSKSLACDLKKSGIAVVAVAPGFVVTEFGPGAEKMQAMGGMPVETSCEGLIRVFDELSIENTGRFLAVQRDTTHKEFPW